MRGKGMYSNYKYSIRISAPYTYVHTLVVTRAVVIGH